MGTGMQQNKSILFTVGLMEEVTWFALLHYFSLSPVLFCRFSPHVSCLVLLPVFVGFPTFLDWWVSPVPRLFSLPCIFKPVRPSLSCQLVCFCSLFLDFPLSAPLVFVTFFSAFVIVTFCFLYLTSQCFCFWVFFWTAKPWQEVLMVCAGNS